MEAIKDTFDELNDEQSEFVLRLMSNFFYRNGVKHDDGSMGTIKISPKEFRDALSFAVYSVNRVI